MQPATLEKLSKPISTKIVSFTPGRIRLRVEKAHRQPREMNRIVSALKATPQINHVRANAQNGSIIIEHAHENGSLDNTFASLRDLGIVFAELTHGSSEAAVGITNAAIDLNKQVAKVTRGVIDLRFLFPLGLSALAMRQLLIRGLQFENIPWYVLAWYSFDSFIKLHNTSKPQP